MTIGSRFPLPLAMTPGAGSVSGNQFRPLKVEMASVRAALGLPAGDKVDATVEADCATRNDALGRLFQRAFKWAPPPMVGGLTG